MLVPHGIHLFFNEVWEEKEARPVLICWALSKEASGTIFITSLVWRGRGSNPRPPAHGASALTTEPLLLRPLSSWMCRRPRYMDRHCTSLHHTAHKSYSGWKTVGCASCGPECLEGCCLSWTQLTETCFISSDLWSVERCLRSTPPTFGSALVVWRPWFR